MKYPHLASFGIAVVAFSIAMTVIVLNAVHLERRNVEQFSDKVEHLKISGSALTRAALARGNIMPLLGSSESLFARSRFRSGAFFKSQPTGFGLFEAARPGESALSIAQYASGLGEAMRGKKIVISYTPESYEIRTTHGSDYGRVFSLLHAYEFIFNRRIPFKSIRQGAGRMIHFRKSLKKDEFLSFAIKQLASRSKLRHGLYFAISPLGYLETFLLRIEDHLLVLQKLWLAALLKVEIDDGHNSRVEIADSSTVPSFVYWLHRYAVDLPAILKELKTPLEPVQYKSTAINWTKLAARGLKMQIPLANNNPYGFDNGLWTRNLEKNFEVYAPGAYDAEYLQMLAESTEWQDLHTLLEVLKTYGAKPLFLGRPMKGHLYDAQGISMAARKVFYDRISSTIRAYGFSVVTFEEFDGDDYFGVDNYPHTGHEAWVYVDKALDEFYHGNLPK